MDSLKLFNQVIPELEELPQKPKVFWYVSAEDDFRGPVFLTQHNINHRGKYNKQFYEKPDLFLYNCIGPEVNQLFEKFNDKNPVLFSDRLTTVTGKNFRQFGFKDDFDIEVSPNFLDVFHNEEYIPKKNNAAIYFELEVKGENYSETQKILYLMHENIDVFRKIILQDFFEVTYLCATREGCGSGGCKKSIIEYIFKDSDPIQLFRNGFIPSYYIIFSDFTLEIFKDAIIKFADLFEAKQYGNYIDEPSEVLRFESNAHLFRAKYNM